MLTLNDETFDGHLSGDQPLLVMFTADFAGPCIAAKETFAEVRNRKGNQIKFALFDLDDNPKVPKRYGLRAVPLHIMFVDGKPVELVAGAVPAERLVEMCDAI